MMWKLYKRLLCLLVSLFLIIIACTVTGDTISVGLFISSQLWLAVVVILGELRKICYKCMIGKSTPEIIIEEETTTIDFDDEYPDFNFVICPECKNDCLVVAYTKYNDIYIECDNCGYKGG